MNSEINNYYFYPASLTKEFLPDTFQYFLKFSLSELFSSEFLYERNSFYVVEKDGTYDLTKKSHSYADEAKRIKEAFDNGHSIRVTNMEQFLNFEKYTKIGNDYFINDIHAYVSPPTIEATAFDTHQDDSSVIIFLVAGEKTFLIEEEGQTKLIDMQPGDALFIKEGVPHKAIPSEKGSLHFSIGLRGEEIYIPGGIDLTETFPDLKVS